MPSTFFAVPLFKKGESFLLRTTNKSEPKAVVVDCGYKAHETKGQKSLQQYLADQVPDLNVIDRLIITHEDADHCEGSGQFIHQWFESKKEIKEVWLPAHWAIAGNAPLQVGYERSRFTDEAFVVAEEIGKQVTSLEPLPSEISEESVTSHFAKSISEALGRTVEWDKLFKDRENHNHIEIQNPGNFSTDFHSHFDEYSRETRYLFGGWNEYPTSVFANNLVREVLDTHTKMASTIAACLRHHVKIRWFDFKSFSEHQNNEPSGGDVGFLIPVNSREVMPTWKRLSYREVFLALALTRANRESLVFYRPEEIEEPSVLFTADSKLKLRHKHFPVPLNMPGERRLLATAMHHASASNNPGYDVLSKWLGTDKYPPIFIRNGGVGVKKAADKFIMARDRQCVRCVPDQNGNSLVRIDAPSGEWQLPAHPKICRCV